MGNWQPTASPPQVPTVPQYSTVAVLPPAAFEAYLSSKNDNRYKDVDVGNPGSNNLQTPMFRSKIPPPSSVLKKNNRQLHCSANYKSYISRIFSEVIQ